MLDDEFILYLIVSGGDGGHQPTRKINASNTQVVRALILRIGGSSWIRPWILSQQRGIQTISVYLIYSAN